MSYKLLLIFIILCIAKPNLCENKIYTLAESGPFANASTADRASIIYDPYYGYYKPETPTCCKADVFEALCNEKVTPILQNLVRLSGTIYYFSPPISSFNPGKNWYQAQDMCRQYGMQLVSLETAAEDLLIKNQVTTVLAANNMQEGSFWMSLNDLSVENSYWWAGVGEPAWPPLVWSPNVPSGASADCGQLVKQGATVLWDDTDCKRPTRFICEMLCPCNELITVI